MLRRLAGAATAATLLIWGPAQASDIVACAAKAREPVDAQDRVECQWKEGSFESTLDKLYTDGWRLLDVKFFNGNREVLYLHRD